MTRHDAHKVLAEHGADILASEGMKRSASFIQHGTVSVAEHSAGVARACVRLARALPFRVCERALVRGALLHDYFLYDWHDRSTSRPHHATRHGSYALENARRDFTLGRIERDMIEHHMFPLAPPPRTREGWILTLADKGVSLAETVRGLAERLRRA